MLRGLQYLSTLGADMDSMQRDQAMAREGKLVPLKQPAIIVVTGLH